MDKRDAERFMSSRVGIIPTFYNYVTPSAANHALSWVNGSVETVKAAMPTSDVWQTWAR